MDISEADTYSKDFLSENNILKRKWSILGTQIVLPQWLQHAVVELSHTQPMAGHLGLEKTKQRILTSLC